MRFNKYYVSLVKQITIILVFVLLAYGYMQKSLMSLIFSFLLGIIFIGFDIVQMILMLKNRINRKKNIDNVVNEFTASELNNDFFNVPINERNIVKLYKTLVEKQNELEVLRAISEKFNSTTDMNDMIEYIFEVFKTFSCCDRCLICFKDTKSSDIYCKYEFGDVILGEVGKLFKSESVITNCFLTNSIVVIDSISIEKRGIVGDKLAIPLCIMNEQIGVIFLETKNRGSFKKANLAFLESLSNYAAVAIHNSDLFNNVLIQKQEIEALYEETTAVNDELSNYIHSLNRAKEDLRISNNQLLEYSDSLNTGYLQTVMSLVNAIEAKDSYTSGHCQRVMEISCEIATRINLDEDSIQDLRYAALLHDIGKIGISADILNKCGKLTDAEFEEIKKHPQISYNILKNVEFLNNGLRAILEHHEKYNGTGYPNGLRGEQISLFGRILCIADAFDPMTSDRTYRKGMTMEYAIEEIERCRGTQFDPEISDLFVGIIRDLITV